MVKLVTEEDVIEKDALKLVSEADVVINNTIKKVNYELINMYWNIGKMIAEYKNNNDIKHGDAVVKRFSEVLSLKYGSGFGTTNIKYSIKFYELFPNMNKLTKDEQKSPPADQLKNITWSHVDVCQEKRTNLFLYSIGVSPFSFICGLLLL